MHLPEMAALLREPNSRGLKRFDSSVYPKTRPARIVSLPALGDYPLAGINFDVQRQGAGAS
jgi:hypothetical protein